MDIVSFPELAIEAPAVLLPTQTIDLSRWPVIACDQFTCEPKYWLDVETQTQNIASSFHMVLPEVYLESLSSEDMAEKIQSINHTMIKYLEEGIFDSYPAGFILLDRTTAFQPTRKGLILAIDLEQYDFVPGNNQPIRATEGTVLSRIPPRVMIRREAELELPHTMLLIDDPEKTVIEPAFEFLSRSGAKPVYDTDLMLEGGHIQGFFTPADSSVSEQIVKALSNLKKSAKDGLLFAVGDGNHSLATAKAHWNDLAPTLSEAEKSTHPARFSLVEVVNLHDPGVEFEPIHRVAFDLDFNVFKQIAIRFFADQGLDFYNEDQWPEVSSSLSNSAQVICLIHQSQPSYFVLTKPDQLLAVESLQNLLDFILTQDSKVRLDYIHGQSVVHALSVQNNLGFLLPPIDKDGFFATISKQGTFPRKTFSMGEAVEKRYYMEAKRIR